MLTPLPLPQPGDSNSHQGMRLVIHPHSFTFTQTTSVKKEPLDTGHVGCRKEPASSPYICANIYILIDELINFSNILYQIYELD